MKVVRIDSESIIFDDNTVLSSFHESDCCEHHYLSFDDVTLKDFEGLEFDLTNDNFFEKVDGYGIRLKPLNGHPVSIPGYGSNNGYYSSDLTLIVENKDTAYYKDYDITECQVISY